MAHKLKNSQLDHLKHMQHIMKSRFTPNNLVFHLTSCITILFLVGPGLCHQKNQINSFPLTNVTAAATTTTTIATTEATGITEKPSDHYARVASNEKFEYLEIISRLLEIIMNILLFYAFYEQNYSPIKWLGINSAITSLINSFGKTIWVRKLLLGDRWIWGKLMCKSGQFFLLLTRDVNILTVNLSSYVLYKQSVGGNRIVWKPRQMIFICMSIWMISGIFGIYGLILADKFEAQGTAFAKCYLVWSSMPNNSKLIIGLLRFSSEVIIGFVCMESLLLATYNIMIAKERHMSVSGREEIELDNLNQTEYEQSSNEASPGISTYIADPIEQNMSTLDELIEKRKQVQMKIVILTVAFLLLRLPNGLLKIYINLYKPRWTYTMETMQYISVLFDNVDSCIVPLMNITVIYDKLNGKYKQLKNQISYMTSR